MTAPFAYTWLSDDNRVAIAAPMPLDAPTITHTRLSAGISFGVEAAAAASVDVVDGGAEASAVSSKVVRDGNGSM